MKKFTRSVIWVGAVCFLAEVWLSVPSAPAQVGRAMLPEEVLQISRLSDPRIAPSGEWIAFVVTRFGPDRRANADVWLVSRDGSTARRLTTGPGSDTHPRWAPDSRTLAFLSRQEGPLSQVYFYDVFSNRITPKTLPENRIRDLKWSPDGSSLALAIQDTPSPDALRRRSQGDDARVVDKDLLHTRLWIMDIETGRARLLTTPDITVTAFNFSPGGEKLAAVASPLPTAEGYEYNSSLGLWDLVSGDETVLSTAVNALAEPTFSPDGQWVTFIGPVGAFKERGIIKVISIASEDSQDLLGEFRGNVWDVAWHPSWDAVLAGVAKGLHLQLISVDRQQRTQFLFEINRSLIPYWQRCWSITPDGKYIAYLDEVGGSPPEIWTATLGGGGRRQLTRFNTFFEDRELGEVEEVRWTNSEDGAEVEGILIKPAGFDPEKKYPLITWFHGGPAYNWSKGAHISNWGQLFATHGYAVLLPNFRGSSGRGMDWMMRNIEDWGYGPMGDVMSGVSHVLRQGWVDKERLYIGGGSYGGYLTEWIVTQTDRFRAAFSRAGIADLITEYQLTDEPSFLLGYFRNSPFESPRVYRENSPLSYASRVKTPLLMVHGEEDERVPLSQSLQFYAALKHYGAEVELVIYPWEGHSIREYAHQQDMMRRVLEWFRKHR